MSNKSKERTPSWLSNTLVLILLSTLGVGLFWAVNRDPGTVTLKLGELKQILQDPSVVFQNVRFTGHGEIRGEMLVRDPQADGSANSAHVQTVQWRSATREYDPDLEQLLYKYVGPAYMVDEEDANLKGITSFLVTTILFMLMGASAFLLIRWMVGGQSPFSFARSKARVCVEKDLRVSFSDVAGIEEPMNELREVVEFLATPEKYQVLGGRIPKGVLLVGPPGTGKTLLAKAVAGEAGVPFFSLSGSEFMELYVGVGAARVRDLFTQAESKAPCIVFIDELDALGKTRSGSPTGSDSEREQTLNQLLVEMDGFSSKGGVIIMGATNRPEMLDAALLRPGRFDRTVVVDRPDLVGREAILKVHSRTVKLGGDVDLKHVARLTPGSVGADLANLVNEAALMAARHGRASVTMSEFNEACERMAVGLKRTTRIMQEEEKKRTAYHEAGHAVVSFSLPGCDPVHKISIIPRGVGALGYVLSRPDDDRYMMTKSQLECRIKMCLGGTMAEELILGEIANGATSDLEKATGIARRMVKEFGMSRLGRVFYGDRDQGQFLSPAFGSDQRKDYSEQTACVIDAEVNHILEDATENVRTILKKHRSALEALAKHLIEKEVIDGEELHRFLLEHFPTLPVAKTEIPVAALPHVVVETKSDLPCVTAEQSPP